MPLEYKRVENFETKKKQWIEMIKGLNNGVIPQGWDNDIFMSSVLKIVEYLDKKFGSQTLPAGLIRDSDTFANQRSNYTINQIVCRRLLKNVKSFVIDQTTTTGNQMGGYYNTLKKLEIRDNILNSNIEVKKDRWSGVNFASEEDLANIFYEEVIIHELLHAISDNDKYVGFESRKTHLGKSFNEGLTENIAIEIAGLRGAYLSKTPFNYKDKTSTFVNAQTQTGYVLEENIANLVRIAKSYILPAYLVDCQMEGFEKGKDYIKLKEIYGTNNPMEYIITKLDLINTNKALRAAKDITPEEKLRLQRENVEIIQDLQSKLIQDIFTFKFTEFTNHIRNAGTISKEEFEEMREAVIIIGRCLVPNINDDPTIAKEDKFSFTHSIQTVKENLKNGNLQPSQNLDNYIQLLQALTGVEKDFERELDL